MIDVCVCVYVYFVICLWSTPLKMFDCISVKAWILSCFSKAHCHWHSACCTRRVDHVLAFRFDETVTEDHRELIATHMLEVWRTQTISITGKALIREEYRKESLV